MEFSISVFKDMTEAVDKLSDTVAKMAGRLVHAVLEGKRGLDYLKSERVTERLKSFAFCASTEIQRVRVYTTPSIRYFLEKPTDVNWNSMKTEVARTVIDLNELMTIIKENAPELAAEPFFHQFIESVMGRQAILKKLVTQPRPRTEDEMRAVALFVE